uniref:cathepsin L2-like n=1 Tax=Pristiophorus japonicus TaxID=55135 RepID=UPI00398F27A1
MKFPLFVGCVVVCILAAASVSTFDPTLDEDWISWKSQHEKQYTEEEEAYRRMVWEDTMRYIEQHNLEHSMGKHTFTVGLNQFADLTTEEFNQRFKGFIEQEAEKSTYKVFAAPENLEQLPAVDWRNKGYVTDVKNQGNCNSCWAFSATGTLEGQLFKKKGKLISLSEQNLIDCDKKSKACLGGHFKSALEYVHNNGISSEAYYPYTAQVTLKLLINARLSNVILSPIARILVIPSNSEDELAKAVALVGPISVAVDANHKSFKNYKKGIYYEPNCTNNVNHAMLVVGYGIRGGEKYWIVKNSYGPKWGIDGYILMAKDRNNNCAIAKYAMYAEI